MISGVEKVPNADLLEAGLELMRQKQMPLTRSPTGSRAMIYQTPSSETVRVRTCNDHLLVVLAEKEEEDARLNVEGTDHVLIVMPEIPRSLGPVIAYLVPSAVVAEAARSTHREWLATKPNTNGKNRTWNLWFEEGPAKAHGFANKWAKYRLSGSASTPFSSNGKNPAKDANGTTLGRIIAVAQQQIAEAAGVPLQAVKISVDLT